MFAQVVLGEVYEHQDGLFNLLYLRYRLSGQDRGERWESDSSYCA